MAGMAYEEIVAAFEAKSVGQDEIQSLVNRHVRPGPHIS